MKANYTITTDVKKESVNEGLSTSLRVFVLVDSVSNLVPQYIPIYIDTETQFFYYFSDKLSEYSQSLKVAYRLLKSGYTLLVMNVRKCNNLLTARLYKDLSTGYFFEDEVDNGIDSKILSESSQLAVKLDLTKFGKNAYILLEQRIRGVISNTLIYTTRSIPLPFNNYHKAIYVDPNLSLVEKGKYLKDQFKANNSFFVDFSDDLTYIKVASPYEFTGTGIYKNCAPVEYDPEFSAKYIERIRYSEKLIDFKSTYTSDIADLKLQVSKVFSKYSISVIKYSNEKVHTTEVFTGELLDVLAQINSSSLFLRVNYSDDLNYLPTGTIELLSLPTNMKVDDSNYEHALELLEEYKQKEEIKGENINHDIRVNIVYEPDIYSIRSQILILDIFDNEDIPIIKVFNYLNSGDEETTQLVSYFDTKYYSYNGEKHSSKELFLKFLIEQGLNTKRTDIYYLGEERPVPYPIYVNEFEETQNGFNAPSVSCMYNNKRFEIQELLIISMVNTLVSIMPKTSETDMHSVISMTETFFESTFGYSPSISLAYFMRVDQDVAVGFTYSVNNPDELKLLELNLKV